MKCLNRLSSISLKFVYLLYVIFLVDIFSLVYSLINTKILFIYTLEVKLIIFTSKGDTAVNGEDKLGDFSGASRSSKEVFTNYLLLNRLLNTLI